MTRYGLACNRCNCACIGTVKARLHLRKEETKTVYIKKKKKDLKSFFTIDELNDFWPLFSLFSSHHTLSNKAIFTSIGIFLFFSFPCTL